ncbi:MAG: hypothetical protein GY711_33085 [bacterium]|nr:hypothetical protein [bacterium]
MRNLLLFVTGLVLLLLAAAARSDEQVPCNSSSATVIDASGTSIELGCFPTREEAEVHYADSAWIYAQLDEEMWSRLEGVECEGCEDAIGCWESWGGDLSGGLEVTLGRKIDGSWFVGLEVGTPFKWWLECDRCYDDEVPGETGE